MQKIPLKEKQKTIHSHTSVHVKSLTEQPNPILKFPRQPSFDFLISSPTNTLSPSSLLNAKPAF